MRVSEQGAAAVDAPGASTAGQQQAVQYGASGKARVREVTATQERQDGVGGSAQSGSDAGASGGGAWGILSPVVLSVVVGGGW
jgi:hypothetical protein